MLDLQDIIWISWRRRLKKSRFFEKSRTDGFQRSSNYAKLIGDRSRTFSARGPNVKCRWPNVEPRYVLRSSRCLASPRSLQTLEPRPTTDKPCATISRPGFVSTLRVICEIDRIVEYFGKEGRFDRIFSNASSDPLTATHKR